MSRKENWDMLVIAFRTMATFGTMEPFLRLEISSLYILYIILVITTTNQSHSLAKATLFLTTIFKFYMQEIERLKTLTNGPNNLTKPWHWSTPKFDLKCWLNVHVGSSSVGTVCQGLYSHLWPDFLSSNRHGKTLATKIMTLVA